MPVLRISCGSVFALVGIVFLALSPSAAVAEIPIATFSAGAHMGEPRISPNGRYLAMPADSGVEVGDVDAPAGTARRTIRLPEGSDAAWVEWANDDRLLIALTVKGPPSTKGSVLGPHVIAVGREGQNSVALFTDRRHFNFNGNLPEIIHTLPDDRDAVLMAASDNHNRRNLYRVDVNTGAAVIAARGSRDTDRWLTDLRGVPRARWDMGNAEGRLDVYLRGGDSDDWKMVARYGERDLNELKIVGFSADPRIAIVASRQDSDRYGLFEYDVAGRKLGKQIFQHATVDVGDPFGEPVYDTQTAELVGVDYVEDFSRSVYFAPDLAAVQAKVDATFAGVATRLTSWSHDRARFIVYTEGPKDPGSYYLYDAGKQAFALIGRTHPDIAESELGEVRVFKYKSRDGTSLPGYLTMPPGKGEKNLPLVVLPHGGPEMRDLVQFDPMAQMLANRGYLVFQPNFRGSGGFGRAFAEAGYRQWGRRMQDDVTDGVSALIGDGTADANRVCIAGISYGGYAALAGGAFTPQLYKCVIAVAGVTDLPSFLDARKRQHGADSSVYRYWVSLLGDRKADLEQMKSVSPALHADKFKAPVLLIHGDADDNVPIDQSRRMDQALRNAGRQVQFVVVKDEGHDFAKPSSDIKLMSELERFLAAHIGK